jgi:copper transport protein
VEIADRDTRITLTIDPARHGTTAFHLYIATPGGALQQVKSANVQLSLPTKSIERLDIPLENVGPNHFTTESGSVPFAGSWQVRVAAVISDFDERVFTTSVRFR